MSLVNCSASEGFSDSEGVSDSSNLAPRLGVPSPKFIKLNSARRPVTNPSPINLVRNSSGEPLVDNNQRRKVHDNNLFHPIGLYGTVSSESNVVDQNDGIVALENAMKPESRFMKMIDFKDQGIVYKSFTTFFLATILVLIYNGLFINFF